MKTITTIALAALSLCPFFARAQNKVTIHDVTGSLEYSDNRKDWTRVIDFRPVDIRCYMRKKPGVTAVLIKDDNSAVVKISNTIANEFRISELPFEKEMGMAEQVYAFFSNLFAEPDVSGRMVTARGGETYSMLFPSDGEIVLDGDVTLTWSDKRQKGYKLYLDEKSGARLCKGVAVTDTVYKANSVSCPGFSSFLPGKTYSWSVVADGGEKVRACFEDFTMADPATRAGIERKIQDIKNAFAGKDPLFAALAVAAGYEGQKAYSAAYRAYSAARRQFPQSDIAATALDKFMKRIIAKNQPTQ